ncbi:MAG: hypothetical protein ACI9O4_000240 [Chitinophagales bacterium]|jgi:hypothetical protein
MKNIFYLAALAALFTSCEYVWMEPDHNHVVNPEMAVVQIYDDFEIEAVTKEDIDYDGVMDYTIIGYDEYGDWVEAVFINNDDIWSTFTFMTGDEFRSDDGYYDDYDDYSDVYAEVEDYFYEIEDFNHVEDVKYADLNSDGYEDAIVIAFYDSEDYQSIDVYVFTGEEEGFYYYGIAEVHYPYIYGDFGAYKDLVIKDEFFTIELSEESPYMDRSITFRYDEFEDEFLLHKDGGKVLDEEGNLIREEVLTQDDFGDVYFYDFILNYDNTFNIKQETWVSSTEEFLNALSSNRVIYLEEGIYELNDINALPYEVRNSYKTADSWEDFYVSDFFTYSCGSIDYESELSLKLTDLKNLDIIGQGDVKLVVTDEMITVLTFENCANVSVENVYMVHDVGGICGANVVDLNYCEDMEFTNCTFDGSGELGVYADACYSLYFNDCQFTNCTSGAIDFYDSDGMFDNCTFKDNEIWQALVAAYSYSSLDFYACDFKDNFKYDYEDSRETQYLFYADEESYIYLDDQCLIKDNEVDKRLNNEEYVLIE